MQNVDNEVLEILLEESRNFLNQTKSHMLDSKGSYNMSIYIDSSDCIPNDVLKELVILDDAEKTEENLSSYIDFCYNEHIKSVELDVAKEVLEHLETIQIELRERLAQNGLMNNVERLRAILVDESLVNISVKKEEIYNLTEMELIYGLNSGDNITHGLNVHFLIDSLRGEDSDLSELLHSQGYTLDDLSYEDEIFVSENYYHSSSFLRALVDSLRGGKGGMLGIGNLFFTRKFNVAEFLFDTTFYTNNNDFKLRLSDYSQNEIYWNDIVIPLENEIELEKLNLLQIK